MERATAIALVKDNVHTRNLINHMIAVGAIMKKLAQEIGEDPKIWEATGILHDIDFEKTKNDPKLHATVSATMLEKHLPAEALHAIRAHNFEYSGVNPKTALDYALLCSDALSGLIVACALVMPSKKIQDVQVKTIEKKFKAKDFARNVSRERINLCAKLDVERSSFFRIGLNALREIASDIGL
ncbi:MAG: HD domain-containing protein [Candidatus Ranarchaeia archaeon]